MNCKKNAPIVWQLFQRRRWKKSQPYHCIVKKNKKTKKQKKKNKKTKKKNKKTKKKKTAFSMKSWLQNLILLIQNIIPWLHATLYLYFSYFFKVWNASLINFFFFSQQCKTWHHQMFACYIRSLLHMPFKWCHIKLFLCWTLTYKFKIFWDHKSESNTLKRYPFPFE